MKEYLKKRCYKLYVLLQSLYDECRYIKNLLSKQKVLSSFKYKLESDVNTINDIIENNKSLSRFGDGEFKWILGIKQESFQDNDELLKARLNEILKQNNPNLLIGIPKSFETTKEYKHVAKRYWINFICFYYKQISNLLSKKVKYANASITRPYIDYKKKYQSKEKFEQLKKLWNQREIIIIEGEKSKLGIGNDLFNNAKTIERIICPSANAFTKYDEILNTITKQSTNKLMLISLGPTATVLAYDLCNRGYQSLDIGHIDIEYEWCLSNARKKENIAGKMTNESLLKNNFTDIYKNDDIYNKQIIERISL